MAIARYFAKDLLAINQLLKSKHEGLEQLLANTCIGVCFSENAVNTKEGMKCLDLLVRLISRLYPKIVIVHVNHPASAQQENLKTLARSINKSIEIVDDVNQCTAAIVAGINAGPLPVNCKQLFIGSNNWVCHFSQSSFQSFQNSENPFGCGIASCVAAANLFKFVFADFFPNKDLDAEIHLSTLDLTTNSDRNPILDNVSLGNLSVVGIGAIGNGLIWGLANMPSLSAEIDLIDHETISLSNLQRYVLFAEDDEREFKVEKAKAFFKQRNVKVNAYNLKWAGYLNITGNWMVEKVAVAIDNKKDRIAIQSALPRSIYNAYTEENLIGIASHTNFIKAPCLACGYIPSDKERNFTEEVAQNCNIPNHSNFVKDYLNLNISVESIYNNNTVSLLDVISTTNGIDRKQLNQFHGKTISEFYSEFVCGGISLSLSTVNHQVMSNVDAPLAFQSAMAGILLACRIVTDAASLSRESLKQQTHIHPLNTFNRFNPFHHNLQKDNSGKCLCSDSTFIERYKAKWAVV